MELKPIFLIGLPIGLFIGWLLFEIIPALLVGKMMAEEEQLSDEFKQVREQRKPKPKIKPLTFYDHL